MVVRGTVVDSGNFRWPWEWSDAARLANARNSFELVEPRSAYRLENILVYQLVSKMTSILSTKRATRRGSLGSDAGPTGSDSGPPKAASGRRLTVCPPDGSQAHTAPARPALVASPWPTSRAA
jgi:hypothetical protein